MTLFGATDDARDREVARGTLFCGATGRERPVPRAVVMWLRSHGKLWRFKRAVAVSTRARESHLRRAHTVPCFGIECRENNSRQRSPLHDEVPMNGKRITAYGMCFLAGVLGAGQLLVRAQAPGTPPSVAKKGDSEYLRGPLTKKS